MIVAQLNVGRFPFNEWGCIGVLNAAMHLFFNKVGPASLITFCLGYIGLGNTFFLIPGERFYRRSGIQWTGFGAGSQVEKGVPCLNGIMMAERSVIPIRP